jgi:hypothetical protein
MKKKPVYFPKNNPPKINKKLFILVIDKKLEMARRSLDHFLFFHINFLKQLQSKKLFLKLI